MLERLAPADELHIPAIVLGEYQSGIATSRRRREYEAWLARGRAFWNVLPIVKEKAASYADVRQQFPCRLTTFGLPRARASTTFQSPVAMRISMPSLNIARLSW